MTSQFDSEKALEVLLYIAARVSDVYTALKVLYFADMKHLAKYGRQISGDSYIAMALGPVPSESYDIVKIARGEDWHSLSIPVVPSLSADRTTLRGLRAADMDYLSESDVECLDEAIQEYASLSFSELLSLSHKDVAYERADRNGVIPIEDIVAGLPERDALLAYLRS